MKILVVGGGGREAALVWRIKKDRGQEVEVYCAPGNAGIALMATCVPIAVIDVDRLVAFAKEKQIDLTVVGPEKPLILGIVDRFLAEGLTIFGPNREAARCEGSKIYFKEFLVACGIPTSPYKTFDRLPKALAYIKDRGPEHIVIKADGDMAGKGVKLPDDMAAAEADLHELMMHPAGKRLIVEDRLYGPERSLIALADGKEEFILPFSQDYKREGEGDTGLNTGGMGSHTIELSKKDSSDLHSLLCRVLAGFVHIGRPYTGFNYLGFIMTENGPMILECNCRLGDPEAQVILPSISGDLVEYLMAGARRELSLMQPPERERHAVCVVGTSPEYPASSECDDPIFGLDRAAQTGALILHAGTKQRADGTFTTGRAGRVLNSIGVDESFVEAHRIAYAGISEIRGLKYRRDIGASLLVDA